MAEEPPEHWSSARPLDCVLSLSPSSPVFDITLYAVNAACMFEPQVESFLSPETGSEEQAASSLSRQSKRPSELLIGAKG